MAQKRMFDKTLIDSDLFLDMPKSTQALYFHLSMRADDDGFINNPKKIQRMIGCSDDDMKLLIAKQYIIPFESGIVVITHWKIHNYIRKDRYTPTLYQEEKAQLSLDQNDRYMIGIPNGNHEGDNMDTQYRIGKVSIEEDSIEEDNISSNDDSYTLPLPVKSSKELLEEEFEKLWSKYPKKVGKAKSLSKYIKYRTSKKKDEYCTFDEVMTGLEKYLKYIEQNSWYKPKDGATWFNNACWKDEYKIEDTKLSFRDYGSSYDADFTPDWMQEKKENKEESQLLIDEDFDELLKQMKGE